MPGGDVGGAGANTRQARDCQGGGGFEFEMHVSISKVLLGLSLAAAATIRNLDAASDQRLEKRGGSDRCPKGQQADSRRRWLQY